MSELEKITGSKILVCCFGGIALQMQGIPPFEFLNYLSTTYNDKLDLLFYIDKNQCWYHKGISGLTTNIPETVTYLDNKLERGNYQKVIFMGVSAGGYASILFGSLCKKVDEVIGFIPQVELNNPVDENYRNLKSIINQHTQYTLYGDINVLDKNNDHHISHCEILEDLKNVTVIRNCGVDMKVLRDNGTIKNIIDKIILNYESKI